MDTQRLHALILRRGRQGCGLLYVVQGFRASAGALGMAGKLDEEAGIAETCRRIEEGEEFLDRDRSLGFREAGLEGIEDQADGDRRGIAAGGIETQRGAQQGEGLLWHPVVIGEIALEHQKLGTLDAFMGVFGQVTDGRTDLGISLGVDEGTHDLEAKGAWLALRSVKQRLGRVGKLCFGLGLALGELRGQLGGEAQNAQVKERGDIGRGVLVKECARSGDGTEQLADLREHIDDLGKRRGIAGLGHVGTGQFADGTAGIVLRQQTHRQTLQSGDIARGLLKRLPKEGFRLGNAGCGETDLGQRNRAAAATGEGSLAMGDCAGQITGRRGAQHQIMVRQGIVGSQGLGGLGVAENIGWGAPGEGQDGEAERVLGRAGRLLGCNQGLGGGFFALIELGLQRKNKVLHQGRISPMRQIIRAY